MLRFDLEAKHEDVSGDPMKNDRTIAAATLTQNLIDGNVLSFGVVFASKPEYLGEVDKELSARVGLKYKLNKGK